MSTSRRRDPRSPARKDTATNLQRDLQPIADQDEAATTGGNIVTIEQGRERRDRRDGARVKGEARPDRADRRERRRTARSEAAATTDPEGPEAHEVEVVTGDGEATAAQPGTVAADSPSAVAAETDAAGSAVAVVEPARGLLVAPLLDAAASARTVERTRTQLEQAEQAIANAADVVGLVAPLVRHVNTVTEQLNEANVTVGRLMAERDALRARLAEAEGVPIEEIAVLPLPEPAGDGEPSSRRLQRIEARQTALQPEESKPNPLRPVGVALGFVPEVDTFDGLKSMARRRQLFAAVLLVSGFTALRIASAKGYSMDTMSRDGLADLAYVGQIFQVFLIAWMLYRVVRVSGKGVSWLFPDPNARKRRR